MHELSLAQNVLEIVQQYLPADNAHAVRCVRMKVGELSGVVIDSLDFCFNALASGTPLQGVRLEIEQIPLRARCRKCSNVFRIENTLFRCVACGSTDLEILSGRELQVTEIELDDGGGNP